MLDNLNSNFESSKAHKDLATLSSDEISSEIARKKSFWY